MLISMYVAKSILMSAGTVVVASYEHSIQIFGTS